MPRRLPDDKRSAILDDVRAGVLSRNAIAKKHEVSVSSVTKLAQETGDDAAFDRSKTKNATRARVADMQSRRAEIAELMLDDVLRLRERAWSRYQVVVSGRDGADVVDLELPPLGEVRSAYTAIGIALDKSMRLVDYDSGDDGNDGAKGLLRTLGEAMTQAAQDLGVADAEEFGS